MSVLPRTSHTCKYKHCRPNRGLRKYRRTYNLRTISDTENKQTIINTGVISYCWSFWLDLYSGTNERSTVIARRSIGIPTSNSLAYKNIRSTTTTLYDKLGCIPKCFPTLAWRQPYLEGWIVDVSCTNTVYLSGHFHNSWVPAFICRKLKYSRANLDMSFCIVYYLVKIWGAHDLFSVIIWCCMEQISDSILRMLLTWHTW